MKGVVSRFYPHGYGFVRSDAGEEIFVHPDEVVDGTQLRQGLRIEFDVDRNSDPRGPVAINVGATGREARFVQHDASPSVPTGTHRGFVRKYDPDRGFGFIKAPGVGRSIFFHAVRSLLELPVAGGVEVEFEMGRDPRSGRPEAHNVRRVPAGKSNEKEVDGSADRNGQVVQRPEGIRVHHA